MTEEAKTQEAAPATEEEAPAPQAEADEASEAKEG